MKLFENDKNMWIGIGVGLLAAGVVKGLAPALSSLGRPVAKGLIKGGILAFESGREAVAHAAEFVEDMVAEVRAEMGAQTGQPAPPPQQSPQGGQLQ